MNPLHTRRHARTAGRFLLALALATGAALAAAGTVTVRARGDMAANVWPVMALRHNGKLVRSISVASTTFADYTFTVGDLKPGARLDLVYTNDGTSNGQDRNLYVASVSDGTTTLVPAGSVATYDRGSAAKAFDGLDVVAAQPAMFWGGALRFVWPAAGVSDNPAAAYDAARLLLQASFGPTPAEVASVQRLGAAKWIEQQIALPATGSHVAYVQSKFDLGDAYRPKGAMYTNTWVAQKFWANAAAAPDQLRKRVAFALHQIFMVSALDGGLSVHARPYANYLDLLDKRAFGNFRDLMQDMALSPVMGIYLSHLRNRPEDPASGRLPDENFAREVMQLFTIGLHELEADGRVKTGADGQPIETYSNADVMALARVFTGWSWARPDNELTESNFLHGNPDYSSANDKRYDLLPMKPYPGQHSLAEKALFSGKPWALTIPAGTEARESLRLALDALFRHPNVGPFIGRQLIQHLVTSDPSPAYVQRVAAAFDNNGSGVRGDLAAVVRAVLLDSEARGAPAAQFGKLREPVLRVAHWMRASGASSASGEYMLAKELKTSYQQALFAPSVFGYFRPGYVPPASAFSSRAATAPEFQIFNESSAAAWINTAQAMSDGGIGWSGSTKDVRAAYGSETSLLATGNAGLLLNRINLLFFAGRMSAELRQALLDAMAGVNMGDATSQLNRVKVAMLLSLCSAEFLVQR